MKRYVILPVHGMRSEGLGRNALQQTGNQVQIAARPGLFADAPIRVIQSISVNGPKLVEMSEQAELELRLFMPDLRIIPEVFYNRPDPFRDYYSESDIGSSSHTGRDSVSIVVKDRDSSAPIQSAQISAFTNFRHKEGVGSLTNADGKAILEIRKDTKIDRLYIHPPTGYWGLLQKSLNIADDTFFLEPIRLGEKSNALTKYYNDMPENCGLNVTVAVIDTGIDPSHGSLRVAGGANMVTDEIVDDPANSSEWRPSLVRGEHGTHVAGIIGANGTPPDGIRGVAPASEIRSYRVFPDSGAGASNFDVMAAIDRAVQDGCHVVNLSLGGPVMDDGVRAAIGDAVSAGTLVVAAAGNSYRKSVCFPAAYDGCVAVTALGDKACFPAHSTESGEIAKPANNEGLFVAGFSNFGPQVKLIAPGVGIVSTVPGGFSAMSGTSMAAPVVTGFAAALLSSSEFLRQQEQRERVQALARALYLCAEPIGFGRDFEGYGLPRAGRIESALRQIEDEELGSENI